jgi:hypothetical protein
MTWINLLVFVHVMAAILLVAGIVGRQITRGQAGKTDDLQVFMGLSTLAGRFENLLVQPGSLAVILVGIILAVLQGWPVFGFLQGGAVNWLLVSNLLILSMLLVIIFIFVPRGKTYETHLQEAIVKGEITPELRAAFNDPLVRWAHLWEEIALVLIIYLMVAKPF